jgi:2-enoate reductase
VSRDLLEGKVTAKGRVVVAGGGCAGAQTAEYLAVRGHRVTLVSLTEQVASDAPSDDRTLLLGRLKKLGVRVLSETAVMAIEQKHVVVENYQGVSRIPADTVVICLGSFSNDFLEEEIRSKVPNVVKIGDAVEPRKVTEAMMEGALAALSL